MRLSIIYILSIFWLLSGVALAEAGGCSLYPTSPGIEALKKEATRLENELRQQPGKIQSHCWLSHIRFKLAKVGDESHKEKMYSLCINSADSALRLDSQAGAAYFMKALCLGKRGELQGLWSSLNIMGPFEENMQRAAQLDPALDRGSPHRGLGKYYMQLPRLLGGSLEKAIEHFEKALVYGPDFWENLLYLGEAYYEDDRYDLAHKTLNRLLQVIDKQASDPELKKPQEKARKLLKKIERYAESP